MEADRAHRAGSDEKWDMSDLRQPVLSMVHKNLSFISQSMATNATWAGLVFLWW